MQEEYFVCCFGTSKGAAEMEVMYVQQSPECHKELWGGPRH